MVERAEVVSRRLGRPPDTAPLETYDRILAAARRVFASDGYAATTNRAIAAAAGITSGAIYHYFASKAELYVAVYEEVQAIVYGEFEKAIAPHERLVARFDAVLARSVELNRADPSIAGFVVGVAVEARRHDEIMVLVSQRRSVNTAFIRRLVDDAVAGGELGPDMSPRALEDLLNAIVSGLTHFGNQIGDPERHAGAVGVLRRLIDPAHPR